MCKFRRTHAFVDRRFQGGLCLRVALYWFGCQLLMGGSLVVLLALGAPSHEAWGEGRELRSVIGTAWILSTLALPLALLDVVVFSNRTSGPLVRLRNSLASLGRGEHVPELHFRRPDHLHDVAEEFNRVRERIASIESHARPGSVRRIIDPGVAARYPELSEHQILLELLRGAGAAEEAGRYCEEVGTES